MPTEIKLPAMSPTMEEGTLAKWLVKEGDTVKPGDVLAEIETDKATMELEADEGGVVAKLHVAAGSDGVRVGTLIATIAGEGEDTSTASATPSLPTPGPSPEGEGRQVGRTSDSSEMGNPSPSGEGRETREARPGGGGVATRPSAPVADRPPPTPPASGRGEEVAADANADTASTTATATGAAPKPGEAPASLQVQPTTPGPTHRQTVREALRDAMAEEMRADPTVFVMGEEVAEYQGAYKVTQGLLEEFGPSRVVDTPITEYGFAGLGTGAAMGGLKPIVEFMTFNFAMQAIDHIINSAAKTNYMSGGQMRCPMVFRGPNGAASRVAAQHSQNYAPWYASVPGLIVIAPYDAASAKGLLKAAIRSPDPVVFLENELMYGHSFDVPDGDVALPIGKAAVVRAGKDVTIVSYSLGVGIALDAATKLAEEGIDAEVVDLRTLRPLDRATVLASLKKTNRMVVVEEAWPVCGIASEIIAIAMEDGFDDLDAPVLRVNSADVPLPYAANLEKLAFVKVEDVVAAVKKVTYR